MQFFSDRQLSFKMKTKQRSKEHFLRDGSPVYIRPIKPDDKQRLLDGFHRMSRESVYSRFFTNKQELTEKELRFLTEVDFNHHVAIVAEIHNSDDGNKADIGIARYVEIMDKGPERIAEVAFAVDEKYQHLGVGSLLFKQLVNIAKKKGITKLVAELLLNNKGMLKILKQSGFQLKTTKNYGVARIEFPIVDKDS